MNANMGYNEIVCENYVQNKQTKQPPIGNFLESSQQMILQPEVCGRLEKRHADASIYLWT